MNVLRLETIVQMVRDAGLATGHADDIPSLMREVLDQHEGARQRIADLEEERDKWRRRFDDACAANELQQIETDKDRQRIADLEKETGLLHNANQESAETIGILRQRIADLERDRDFLNVKGLMQRIADLELERDEECESARRFSELCTDLERERDEST